MFYAILPVLLLAWCAMYVLFRSRMKRTGQEIDLLPKTSKVFVQEQHHLVGRQLTYIHSRVQIPEYIWGRDAVVMLFSTTCPFCLARLEEFMEDFLPRHPLPFICLIQTEDERELSKFDQLYPGLPMIPVDNRTFVELELDMIPGFLLVREDGVIADCQSQSRFLLQSA